MEVSSLYRMAQQMTSTISTSDREDIIQDAVFYCWQTLKRKSHCNTTYIRERMRKSILSALDRYSKQKKTAGVEGLEEMTISWDPEIISLPIRTKDKPGLSPKQREVVEALIRNNFEIDSTARELGMSSPTLSIHWSWARKALKRAYEYEN